MTDEAKKFCNLAALARLLDVTPRRITELVREQVLPKPACRGRYDLFGCTHAYIKFWKDKAAGHGNRTDQKLKETKLAAAEFDLQLKRGAYIPRATVVDELVKRVYVIKHDQLALERRLNRYPEAKEVVKAGHRAMWRKYSQPTGVFKQPPKPGGRQ